ncbi:MAG: transcriptional regulator [Pseudonocardiales bacterium]|nr:MAG: transcriptional regulator [Pseudonocardiales bacterium]
MPIPIGHAGWTPDPLDADCPSRQVLALIADKWSVLVLSAIADGNHRNGQLLRRVGGISQKALTRTLRALEHDGLIERHDHRSVPLRVDYTLSAIGESIRPVCRELCQWAITHMPDVEAARRRHDIGTEPVTNTG